MHAKEEALSFSSFDESAKFVGKSSYYSSKKRYYLIQYCQFIKTSKPITYYAFLYYLSAILNIILRP